MSLPQYCLSCVFFVRRRRRECVMILDEYQRAREGTRGQEGAREGGTDGAMTRQAGNSGEFLV
jgi:hypothetical protein